MTVLVLASRADVAIAGLPASTCRLAFAEQRLRFLAGLRRAAGPSGDPREPACDAPLPLNIPGGCSASDSSVIRELSGDAGVEGPQLGPVGTSTAAEAVLAGEVAQLARERALLLHRLEVRQKPHQCMRLVINPMVFYAITFASAACASIFVHFLLCKSEAC